MRALALTGNEQLLQVLLEMKAVSVGCQDTPHFLSADIVFVIGMLTT